MIKLKCSVPSCSYATEDGVPDWNLALKLLEVHSKANHSPVTDRADTSSSIHEGPPSKKVKDIPQTEDTEDAILDAYLSDVINETGILNASVDVVGHNNNHLDFSNNETNESSGNPSVGSNNFAASVPVDEVENEDTQSKGDKNSVPSDFEALTVNEEPEWFELFRSNFNSIITEHLDSKVKDSIRNNRVIVNEIEKKRVSWPIMKRVTEYLFAKFGGQYPLDANLKQVSAELGYQYPNLFRTFGLQTTSKNL